MSTARYHTILEKASHPPAISIECVWEHDFGPQVTKSNARWSLLVHSTSLGPDRTASFRPILIQSV